MTAISSFSTPDIVEDVSYTNKYPPVWIELSAAGARKLRDVTMKAAADGKVPQRNLNERHVARIERDIRAGNFTDSPDAFCYTNDGIILNGNHRAEGIARSGCTVRLLAIPNAPLFIRLNADKTHVRSSAQQLDMNYGIKESKIKIALINAILMTKYGNTYSSPQFSDSELLVKITNSKFLIAFERLNKIRTSTEITKATDRTKLRSVISMTPFILAYHTNPEMTELLYNQFLNGLGFVNNNEALKKFREHVLDGDMTSGSGRPLILRRGIYTLNRILCENNNYIQNMPSGTGVEFTNKYNKSVQNFLATLDNFI